MRNDKIFDKIIGQIIKDLESIHYKGDLSDIGNEIGVSVGRIISNTKIEEIGFGSDDFISGFKHGISLTDGTHG